MLLQLQSQEGQTSVSKIKTVEYGAVGNDETSEVAANITFTTESGAKIMIILQGDELANIEEGVAALRKEKDNGFKGDDEMETVTIRTTRVKKGTVH